MEQIFAKLNSVYNIIDDSEYWIPEYWDRYRILQLKSDCWKYEEDHGRQQKRHKSTTIISRDFEWIYGER